MSTLDEQTVGCRYRSRLACITIASSLLCAGCGSDTSSVAGLPDKQENNTENTSQQSSQSECDGIRGLTPDGPIDTGFWKETDDRLVLYRYSIERGDNGEYAEIAELHRSQMSAETLAYLEFMAFNTYSVDVFFRHRQYGEDDALLCAAEELAYPDCQPKVSAELGTVFDIAVSSGSVGEPVAIISSNACGPVDLFNPDDLAGVVNPHSVLTSLPQIAIQ